ERVRQQEISHLVAAVVENQRAPVLMLALTRVGVLVERRTIEPCQAVLVLREVTRYPVQNHAQARLMTRVDEQLEILGGTEPAGRCEKPEHLVSPRPGEGMFHHRQQLDVCK